MRWTLRSTVLLAGLVGLAGCHESGLAGVEPCTDGQRWAIQLDPTRVPGRLSALAFVKSEGLTLESVEGSGATVIVRSSGEPYVQFAEDPRVKAVHWLDCNYIVTDYFAGELP